MNRRAFLRGMAAAPLAGAVVSAPAQAAAQQTPSRPRVRIRQGVMPQVWGTTKLTFEQRCETLARIGYQSVDLPTPEQAPLLKKYGLAPSMMTGTGTSFQNGLVRREMHDAFEKATRDGIDMCARVGCPNLIALPGERRGMSREEGADHAVAFFDRVKGYAEQRGITLCMEITNSKVAEDQRTDQMFDRLAWGLDVCKRVGSPRVKIVYDAYHVQVADGDVTRNLRDHFDWICHIHVAGVPGRLEIDDTQELNYRFIANAIGELGYAGFVSHEWRPGPGRDAIDSLERCFTIMDV